MNDTIPQVVIGKQVWTKQNLDVAGFQNNEPIFEARNESEWLDASRSNKPACCYMNFDASQPYYGRLYNWFAVNDPRGLAPDGWRVPTAEDWRELVFFLGESQAGRKMKTQMWWPRYGEGTDESGFSGLPGGCCTHGGGFIFRGEMGFWWGSSVSREIQQSAFTLVLSKGTYTGQYYYSQTLGQSVRFVKNV